MKSSTHTIKRERLVNMATVATDAPQKRITTNIDPELFRSIKVAAVLRDTHVADIVSEALAEWLKNHSKQLKTDGSPIGA